MPVALPPMTAPRADSATRSRWPLVVGALLLLTMIAGGRLVDVEHYARVAHEWTGGLGRLAPLAYVLAYVAATLVGLPSMPFTLLAPVLFGVPSGIAVMVVASAASAALAFLIARYLARAAVTERMGGTAGFARLSALVDAHDWVLIPLLRIFPIAPFTVVNYGFGLTRIGFWRYLVWSIVAMIPSNVALVLGASLFYDATTRGTFSWSMAAAVVAGLASVALVAVARRGWPRLTRWVG